MRRGEKISESVGSRHNPAHPLEVRGEIWTGQNSTARDADATLQDPFAVSVVVPTRDEAASTSELLMRLGRLLRHRPREVVFIDDSSDDTPYIVNAAVTRGARSVRLLARERDSRPGGLGGAVHAGLRAARAPWVCVIGGDLQDPPEAIPQLIRCAHQAGADLVVGVGAPGRGVPELGRGGLRYRLSTKLSRALFPNELAPVSDTLSGLFLLRKSAVRLEELQLRGHRVLLEIVDRNPGLRIAEIPYRFTERAAGASKANLGQAVSDAMRVLSLRLKCTNARTPRASGVSETSMPLRPVRPSSRTYDKAPSWAAIASADASK